MSEHDCKYEGIVKETHQMVREIHKAIYVGNGKDSLVTRIDRNTEKHRVLSRFAWGIASTIIVIIGKLVYDHMKQ